MKRNILTLGLLSLAALGLAAADASAYWWRFCCCKHSCCTITMRPYNAFSPVCCGTAVWNGGCTTNCCAPITAWTPDHCIPAPPYSADIRIPNGTRNVYVSPITPHGQEYSGYPQPSDQTWKYPQPYTVQRFPTQPGAHQSYYRGNWTPPQTAPVPTYWHRY